jgi:hypothetical protein
MRHSLRLVVAAEEAPRERSKAAPPPGPPPLTSLAKFAPETAPRPFSLLLEKIAVTCRVRRHCCLRHLPRSHAAAAHCAVSFSTPFPLLCGCHHCVQAYAKLVRGAVQAWWAGFNSRASKAQLARYEQMAKNRAMQEAAQAMIDGRRRRREEREHQERCSRPQTPNHHSHRGLARCAPGAGTCQAGMPHAGGF